MNGILQSSIVALVVVTAGGYASIKLMPGAWRRGLAARAAGWATATGLSEVVARRVEAKLSSGGACGSCESCKACATPDQPEEGPTGHRSIAIRRV